MENGKILISKKKFIFTIVILIIVIAIVIINSNKNVNNVIDNVVPNKTENTVVNNNGEKINTSSKLKESKNVNGLYIDKIELKNVSNRTTFTADITNKTTEVTKGKLYDIVFIDKTGKQIGSMGLYIRAIEPNKTISIEASIEMDVTDCYNFNLQSR